MLDSESQATAKLISRYGSETRGSAVAMVELLKANSH